MSSVKNHKLLDEVHEVMRLRHYSIHTERSYCDWIRRFVRFHKMQSRDDLKNGEVRIEQFLTHLAVKENVSPSTQNQAMNALVFLYRQVLGQTLDGKINAIRAEKKKNIPVVMTQDEVVQVLSFTEGTSHMVVRLLYGSGLRIMEAIRLRVHDIEFGLRAITVRSGKGDKDRVTTLAESVIPLLKNHLTKVGTIHKNDLSQGYGEVYLPYALARKYPHAAKEWQWQYVFPSRSLSTDPRSGIARRLG